MLWGSNIFFEFIKINIYGDHYKAPSSGSLDHRKCLGCGIGLQYHG